MTSDSSMTTTEQAARVGTQALSHWPTNQFGDVETTPDRAAWFIARALADAGLLAHQAPATEDEAAEVEWAIAYGDDPTDASTETHDRAEAEARLERLRKKHADLILVTRAVTPWREVSS